jgi:hypothetical protein
MMKRTLRQRLRDWLIQDDMPCETIISSSRSIQMNTLDSDRGIRFNVYKATGGTVIETSFYDRHKDRHNSSLHVITDDQDLGKEIGKIITMETLKQ